MEISFTDYITAQEIAEEWGVSKRMVIRYCVAGRLPGAIKSAGRWFIPRNTVKPADGRSRNGRKPSFLNNTEVNNNVD